MAIRFEHLGHAYRQGQWVFRNYAAGIRHGAVFAVLGPNGRGKSTLLHVMLGVLRPTEGVVTLNGRTAFVPQLFRTAFAYTVLDMVLMGRAQRIGLWSQPTPADERAALVALDRFGLADMAERPFDELSGGQRQMAILARALVAEAEILVLDEPCSALDLHNQVLILDWIGRLAHEDELTVVFTTHNPQHALAVADEVLLMLDERRFVHGPADDTLTEANLETLYGVPLRRVAATRPDGSDAGFVPAFPTRRRSAAFRHE